MSCQCTGTNTRIPSENFSAKFDHFSQRGNMILYFRKTVLTFLFNSKSELCISADNSGLLIGKVRSRQLSRQ